MIMNTTKEINANIELQVTIAKLRAAQVELLLLEEEYQDGDFRAVIDRLETVILKIQSHRF